MSTAFNSVTKAVSGNAQKIKNSSTVLGITQTPTSNVSNALTIRASTYNQGKNNGRNVATATGHAKALSSGTFGFQQANKWVVLSGAITLSLSGVSTNVLRGAGSDAGKRPIPYKLTNRTGYLRGLSWTTTSLSGPVYTFTRTSNTISYNDTEAVLGRTVRGNLVFMKGSILPYSTNYRSLTLW